jgi:hypothetical protein
MTFPPTVFAVTGLVDDCDMTLEQGAGRWQINIEKKQCQKKKRTGGIPGMFKKWLGNRLGWLGGHSFRYKGT